MHRCILMANEQIKVHFGPDEFAEISAFKLHACALANVYNVRILCIILL